MLRKAAVRVKVLRAHLEADDFSDVVREAQEVVELGPKALLRFIGVEPHPRCMTWAPSSWSMPSG